MDRGRPRRQRHEEGVGRRWVGPDLPSRCSSGGNTSPTKRNDENKQESWRWLPSSKTEGMPSATRVPPRWRSRSPVLRPLRQDDVDLVQGRGHGDPSGRPNGYRPACRLCAARRTAATRAILLPERPRDDLLALAATQGIKVVWPHFGSFEEHSPGEPSRSGAATRHQAPSETVPRVQRSGLPVRQCRAV